jgi:hypothetical protein
MVPESVANTVTIFYHRSKTDGCPKKSEKETEDDAYTFFGARVLVDRFQ